jgi:NAD(P)-dependent dehydrogenase (short-subunit alcohol dehydrogenase family)
VKEDNLNCALVLGASGGIGSAVMRQFLEDSRLDKIVAVSREKQPQDMQWGASKSKILWIQCRYDETSMTDTVMQLSPYKGQFSRVCICHGVLHQEDLQPEKRLEDINESNMQTILHSNVVIPSLWLKLLFDLVKGTNDCVVVALSARVGSISDNKLGGWYAYRASKSALNMVMKTAAIEYCRRAKNVKLIAFHPGTTDTNLSKPFQKRVAEDKLFTPKFVAAQLAGIMDRATVDGQLSFLDWEGKSIDW